MHLSKVHDDDNRGTFARWIGNESALSNVEFRGCHRRRDRKEENKRERERDQKEGVNALFVGMQMSTRYRTGVQWHYARCTIPKCAYNNDNERRNTAYANARTSLRVFRQARKQDLRIRSKIRLTESLQSDYFLSRIVIILWYYILLQFYKLI